jgi:hypothetical protein
MKLQGRKSGNVIDIRKKDDADRYATSRQSLNVAQKDQETIVRDARRVIPKKVVGFDVSDMIRSNARSRVDKKQDRLKRIR